MQSTSAIYSDNYSECQSGGGTTFSFQRLIALHFRPVHHQCGARLMLDVQNYQVFEALPSDAPALADLRVSAMRPSLEAIGRFDPQRARDRFLNDFVKSNTFKICIENQTAGFYSLMTRADHLWLAHFYISPRFQNGGLGATILDDIKQQAFSTELPLRLGALRQSKANRFYLKHGFVLTHSMEYDHYYEWKPQSNRLRLASAPSGN